MSVDVFGLRGGMVRLQGRVVKDWGRGAPMRRGGCGRLDSRLRGNDVGGGGNDETGCVGMTETEAGMTLVGAGMTWTEVGRDGDFWGGGGGCGRIDSRLRGNDVGGYGDDGDRGGDDGESNCCGMGAIHVAKANGSGTGEKISLTELSGSGILGCVRHPNDEIMR